MNKIINTEGIKSFYDYKIETMGTFFFTSTALRLSREYKSAIWSKIDVMRSFTFVTMSAGGDTEAPELLLLLLLLLVLVLPAKVMADVGNFPVVADADGDFATIGGGITVGTVDFLLTRGCRNLDVS